MARPLKDGLPASGRPIAMTEVMTGHGVLVAILVIVLALVLAWWLLVASRRTTIERSSERPSEGLPARRNQALIDAEPAATEIELPSPTPAGLAGVGEAVAATTRPVPETVAGDDLRRIKGVGPKLAALLNSLGVTSYSQIAAWDDDEIDRIDAQLGTFSGRIRRDDWPTQARYLASGDMAGFEERFGRL
jgi:predicted flap endonuclease-1-like 5' DNA nuclease